MIGYKKRRHRKGIRPFDASSYIMMSGIAVAFNSLMEAGCLRSGVSLMPPAALEVYSGLRHVTRAAIVGFALGGGSSRGVEVDDSHVSPVR